VNKHIGWVRLLVVALLALLLLPASQALALGPTAAAPLYSVTGTAVVNTGALNVRSGPGVGYSIVATLTTGQSVTLIGRNAHGSWAQIRTSVGTEGWVNAGYLLSNIAISSLPVTDAGMPTAVVNTGVLNVRSGPGVGFGAVAVTYQGYVVNLLGRNANATWAKVQLPTGVQGWVNASLIHTSVPLGNLPNLDGTPSVPGGTAVVATGALNVRSGPGVGYSVVAVISYGQTVTLIGRNSAVTWAQIRLANGTVGWVNASLLQLSVSLSSLPNTESSAAPTPTAVVNTWALNVRYGPGVGYNIVTAISQGQQVTLLGRNSANSWVQVRLANGVVGWVNASLVQTNVAVATLPITG
jgi:N-acetylmuramoyl-L-alanine amidase